MNLLPNRKHWFRAMPHGVGYGLPTCWEGWAMLVVYLVLVFAAVAPIVIYGWGVVWYFVFVGILSLALVVFVTCGHKGPRLRWRWDENDMGDYPLGHCQGCGYNLPDNLSGVCPQCGAKCEDE